MSKRNLVIIGVAILLFLFVFVILNRKDTSGNLLQSTKNITSGEDVCVVFPKDWVSKAIGKPILKTKTFSMNGTYNCQYYVDDTNAAFIKLENLRVANQKKGQQELGRTIKTDPRIKMEHFIAVQENGLINTIYLVLNQNSFVAIDRTSVKVYDNEGEINFAIKVAEKVQSGPSLVIANNQAPTVAVESEKKQEAPTSSKVISPQAQDAVNNFFSLINEGKVSDAVSMMSPKAISDDSQKQAWGVQFNSFKKITVKKIEPSLDNSYKVTLDVLMKPESANAQPMPYYGYGDGEFIRWVGVEKIGNVWKITGIATGP